MRTRRITIEFMDEAARTLERLAVERGCTTGEVMRVALGREAWFRRLERDGGRVFVRSQAGEYHEVEFVR